MRSIHDWQQSLNFNCCEYGDIKYNHQYGSDTNETLDLGSADKKWRDLYLGGNSLHLDNVVMKVYRNI